MSEVSTLIGITRKESGRLMAAWWRELEAAAEAGRPVANTFVMGSFAEILTAFDIPLCFPEITSLQTAFRGQSMAHLLRAEDYGYSPDICGYVKVDVGLHLEDRKHPNGRLPLPSLVVTSNMCNTYIKWSEIWERLFNVPNFVFDLPGVRGTGFRYEMDTEQFRQDCRYVETQMRELIRLCERVTGQRFDIDRLREVMAETNRMGALYEQILAANKHRPAPYNAVRDGVVYQGVVNCYRGRPEGTQFLATALAELAERAQKGIGTVPAEKFRLLFSGSACYTHFRQFVDLFDRWGGVFVSSEYAAFASGGLDRGIAYDLHRPLESLAEQLPYTSRLSFSNMFFNQHWQADTVRDWYLDGIVFHVVKSCRTISTGLADHREWQVRNHDTPSLLLESDLVDARLYSEAQLRNRIDAYFEALDKRRNR